MRGHVVRLASLIALAVVTSSDPYLCSWSAYPEFARAVFLVDYKCRVAGVLGGPAGPSHQAKVTVRWRGSATAVSSGGDLLTARHVVDIAYHHPELCRGRFSIMREATVIGVKVAVSGPGGQRWQGVAVAELGRPCDDSGRFRLSWDPMATATVAAVDVISDLALIRVAASGLPHLNVHHAPIDVGSPVIAIGADRSRWLRPSWPVERGVVVKPCVMDKDVATSNLMPTVMMSAHLRRGMSGGPVISDGRLAGINVQTMVVPPFRSYAIYGPYVADWYDWVRGATSVGPDATCR